MSFLESGAWTLPLSPPLAVGAATYSAVIHHHVFTHEGATWLSVGWAVSGGRAQASSMPLVGTVEAALVDAFLALTRSAGTDLRLYVSSPVVRRLLAEAYPQLRLPSLVAGDALRAQFDRARAIALASARPVCPPADKEALPSVDLTVGPRRARVAPPHLGGDDRVGGSRFH